MDAIFLTVGTGIGAGILTNGEILRGSNDIAGAIGWMALARPFREKYRACGCFEFHSSGTGLARSAEIIIAKESDKTSVPGKKPAGKITSRDLFNAFENGERAAKKVIKENIEYWGMAVANLISIFNPEKIIFGGGVFGPARQFIPQIRAEAEKWAQPVAMKQVTLEVSALSGDAALFGAGYLALQKVKGKRRKNKIG
jgi:glucokinase